jgi:predicted metal-binding membrane protein
MEQQVAQARPAAGSPAARGPASGWIAGQAAPIGVLLALAAAAWVVTDPRMVGMDAGPGTDPGALGFYISIWVVMMAAMMAPAIAPMVLAHRSLGRAGRGRCRPHRPRCTPRRGWCPRPERRPARASSP